jgi:hypothetical protein
MYEPLNDGLVWFMVLNATFNNISAISDQNLKHLVSILKKHFIVSFRGRVIMVVW